MMSPVKRLMRVREKLSGLWRDSSGSALVETTLIIPVAISLMAGATDFGIVFSTASSADKSMRDAARYLARLPQSSVCSSWALTKAQNLAVYGNLAGSGNPLITGWKTSNVTLAQPTDCTTLTNTPIIQLKATVPYTGIMLSALGLSNSLTLNVQHEERWIGE
jgi:Flp pilus assembly protein TadG